MSVVLTVISLGVRVALAYTLAAIPGIGVWGIWWSIPIGWFGRYFRLVLLSNETKKIFGVVISLQR